MLEITSHSSSCGHSESAGCSASFRFIVAVSVVSVVLGFCGAFVPDDEVVGWSAGRRYLRPELAASRALTFEVAAGFLGKGR